MVICYTGMYVLKALRYMDLKVKICIPFSYLTFLVSMEQLNSNLTVACMSLLSTRKLDVSTQM